MKAFYVKQRSQKDPLLLGTQMYDLYIYDHLAKKSPSWSNSNGEITLELQIEMSSAENLSPPQSRFSSAGVVCFVVIAPYVSFIQHSLLLQAVYYLSYGCASLGVRIVYHVAKQAPRYFDIKPPTWWMPSALLRIYAQLVFPCKIGLKSYFIQLKIAQFLLFLPSGSAKWPNFAKW